MDKGWCRGVDTIGRLKSGVTYVMYVCSYTTNGICHVYIYFFSKKINFLQETHGKNVVFLKKLYGMYPGNHDF